MAAAVGSLIMRRTLRPAIIPENKMTAFCQSQRPITLQEIKQFQKNAGQSQTFQVADNSINNLQVGN